MYELTSSFRGGSLVMWLHPLNHQRSWQCTLLQTTHMLKLYISSCCNLMFLKVKFSILCCDNTVHMVWLGVGAKNTWSGLGKHHVLVSNSGFGCYKQSWKLSQGLLEVIQWFHTFTR